MFPPKFAATSKSGLSLVELLIVMVLCAVLLVLTIPVGSRMRERSREARCVSQLHQIGQLLHGYIGANGGRYRFTRDGSGTRLWYNELKQFGGLSDEDARRLFRCPSLPMGDILANVEGWYCYGFRLDYVPPTYRDPGLVTRDDSSGIYELTVARVDNPAAFFVMADSVNADTRRQTMRLLPRNGGLYGSEGIHLRHSNRANVLFLDGHVETLPREGFAPLGIQQMYDANLKVVSSVPN